MKVETSREKEYTRSRGNTRFALDIQPAKLQQMLPARGLQNPPVRLNASSPHLLIVYPNAKFQMQNAIPLTRG